MLGTGAHLLRSHRCSGTCSDSGRPLKSMNTFASAHTNSFLYASQYIVPHSEQHCNRSRHQGFSFWSVWESTCSSMSPSKTLSIFFINSCRFSVLGFQKKNASDLPCCGDSRARHQPLPAPAKPTHMNNRQRIQCS